MKSTFEIQFKLATAAADPAAVEGIFAASEIAKLFQPLQGKVPLWMDARWDANPLFHLTDPKFRASSPLFMTIYSSPDLWICKLLTDKWEWNKTYRACKKIFSRALQEFQKGQYAASLARLVQQLKEMVAGGGIDITVCQAVQGSLEALGRYPITAFSAALAFHITDTLFYILTPPDLLLAKLRGGKAVIRRPEEFTQIFQPEESPAPKGINERVLALSDNKDYDFDFDPQSARAWTSLGSLYESHKKDADAERCFKKALEIDPDDVNAWNTLGHFYIASDLEADAERCFQEVLCIDPDNGAAWEALGSLYDNQCNYAEAERCFKKAMGLLPELDGVWYKLGGVYAIQERNADAEQAYLKAIELGKYPYQAWKRLGELYEAQNRLADAKKCFKAARACYKAFIESEKIRGEEIAKRIMA